MGHQLVFKRYELKYMLTHTQKEKILEAMKPYMRLDAYGRSTVSCAWRRCTECAESRSNLSPSRRKRRCAKLKEAIRSDALICSGIRFFAILFSYL